MLYVHKKNIIEIALKRTVQFCLKHCGNQDRLICQIVKNLFFSQSNNCSNLHLWMLREEHITGYILVGPVPNFKMYTYISSMIIVKINGIGCLFYGKDKFPFQSSRTIKAHLISFFVLLKWVLHLKLSLNFLSEDTIIQTTSSQKWIDAVNTKKEINP